MSTSKQHQADEAPRGPRVLVVEDELIIALALEEALVDRGYDVIGPVGRLDQAMKLARSEAIEFGLLDVNLRGQQGFAVADVLAERGIPFAFMTGYGREVLPGRFDGVPALRKPFGYAAMFRMIEQAGKKEPAAACS